MYQRPVAIRQSSKIGMRCAIFELLIQGPAAAQHAIEDLGGDPARGKAGRINSGCARGHALNWQGGILGCQGPWSSFPPPDDRLWRLSPGGRRVRLRARVYRMPARGDDNSLS